MHPLDAAKALNDAAGGTTWEQDVAAHWQTGHFLASADCVLMWRSVRSDWSPERLLNPWDSDPGGDAWYIWSAAGVGALPRFAAMARSGGWPEKTTVAFHRRGIPKWYRLEAILSRIDGQKLQQRRSSQGAERSE